MKGRANIVSDRAEELSGFRVEADRSGTARSRVESKYGFEGVFVGWLWCVAAGLGGSAGWFDGRVLGFGWLGLLEFFSRSFH